MTEHSYNGWPASPDPAVIGVKPFVVAGHSFPGGVKTGDVALVMSYVVTNVHLRVESLGIPGPADEWGYSYRADRNDASLLSCHASGTAVDVNASHHPNGSLRTFSTAQVATIHAILLEAGGVVKWGGDFHGTVDQMHFEIHGTSAQVHDVALRLAHPRIFTRNLTLQSPVTRGADVKHFQQRLIGCRLLAAGTDDGFYGPHTAGAVKLLQNRLEWAPTGRLELAEARALG